jgi:hypothetical protein
MLHFVQETWLFWWALALLAIVRQCVDQLGALGGPVEPNSMELPADELDVRELAGNDRRRH